MLVGSDLLRPSARRPRQVQLGHPLRARGQDDPGYHKLHLVPFGEYVPLIETFPWLTVLTPYRNGYVPSLNFGREPNSLAIGPYRIAAAICFEDTVPHVVRRFFHEAPDGRQPDVLLNLSNDGWFHGSSELDMHLAVSVFRAIENRVPLARAVNTGISALVDGNGEIRDTLPRQTESVLTVDVPLDDRTSLYTVCGDWLGLSCLAVTIGLVPMGLLRRVGPGSSLLLMRPAGRIERSRKGPTDARPVDGTSDPGPSRGHWPMPTLVPMPPLMWVCFLRHWRIQVVESQRVTRNALALFRRIPIPCPSTHLIGSVRDLRGFSRS